MSWIKNEKKIQNAQLQFQLLIKSSISEGVALKKKLFTGDIKFYPAIFHDLKRIEKSIERGLNNWEKVIASAEVYINKPYHAVSSFFKSHYSEGDRKNKMAHVHKCSERREFIAKARSKYKVIKTEGEHLIEEIERVMAAMAKNEGLVELLQPERVAHTP